MDDVDGPECLNNDELLPYDTCIQPDNPIENELHGQPVVDFAPAQGNVPLSMLTDVNAEALALSNLLPLGCGHFNDSSRHDSNNMKLGIAKNLFKSSYAKISLLNSKVRVSQLRQDRAFNSFAICLAYESSANFKVKCEQVWPIIII